MFSPAGKPALHVRSFWRETSHQGLLNPSFAGFECVATLPCQIGSSPSSGLECSPSRTNRISPCITRFYEEG